jgi:hypothetical protein
MRTATRPETAIPAKVIKYYAPGVDENTFRRWCKKAGGGTSDERAARIASGLINRIAEQAGIPLESIEPYCSNCDTPIVLVGQGEGRSPKWLHVTDRETSCLSGSTSASLKEV